MKTLRKALDILEYAVLRGGGSVTPGEAAEATGVNPATATRILRALTERGYLVQISRKRGYAPGPMVTSIGTRRNQFSSLAAASEAPLKELSARLGRQVNISVLDGSSRVMLRFCAPDPGFVCWDHFFSAITGTRPPDGSSLRRCPIRKRGKSARSAGSGPIRQRRSPGYAKRDPSVFRRRI